MLHKEVFGFIFHSSSKTIQKVVWLGWNKAEIKICVLVQANHGDADAQCCRSRFSQPMLSCLSVPEMPWTRWRTCMRRTHRWETPAVFSLKYQKPFVTWRSCARKSTKTRYKKLKKTTWSDLIHLSANDVEGEGWEKGKTNERMCNSFTCLI